MAPAIDLLVPALLLCTALWGLWKRVDLWSALVAGAGEGLRTCARIAPALIGLLTAVYMLRASGALDLLGEALSPLLHAVGIPPETVPLLLIRPVSGSAAMGVGADIIAACGPDSTPGRIAAVMLGSTETTFYTIAVYFGAARVTRTRYAVPAAICGDLVGFLTAGAAVRLFFPH